MPSTIPPLRVNAGALATRLRRASPMAFGSLATLNQHLGPQNAQLLKMFPMAGAHLEALERGLGSPARHLQALQTKAPALANTVGASGLPTQPIEVALLSHHMGVLPITNHALATNIALLAGSPELLPEEAGLVIGSMFLTQQEPILAQHVGPVGIVEIPWDTRLGRAGHAILPRTFEFLARADAEGHIRKFGVVRIPREISYLAALLVRGGATTLPGKQGGQHWKVGTEAGLHGGFYLAGNQNYLNTFSVYSENADTTCFDYTDFNLYPECAWMRTMTSRHGPQGLRLDMATTCYNRELEPRTSLLDSKAPAYFVLPGCILEATGGGDINAWVDHVLPNLLKLLQDSRTGQQTTFDGLYRVRQQGKTLIFTSLHDKTAMEVTFDAQHDACGLPLFWRVIIQDRQGRPVTLQAIRVTAENAQTIDDLINNILVKRAMEIREQSGLTFDA